MSRCVCCNKRLSSFELTRKIEREDGSTEYPDMCNKCFGLSGLAELVSVSERHDLKQEEEIDENDFNED